MKTKILITLLFMLSINCIDKVKQERIRISDEQERVQNLRNQIIEIRSWEKSLNYEDKLFCDKCRKKYEKRVWSSIRSDFSDEIKIYNFELRMKRTCETQLYYRKNFSDLK